MTVYESARVIATQRARRDAHAVAQVAAVPVRWVTSSGEVVFDLRTGRRTRQFPHVPKDYRHCRDSPDGTCRVTMAFGDTAQVLSLTVHDQAVHVFVNPEVASGNLFPWLAPGIRGAMSEGMWTRNMDAVVQDWYDNREVRSRHAWQHVPVVHAALLDPARWWAGSRRRSGLSGMRHLLGWASTGAANASDAHGWVVTGLRPDDVVNWRAAGWRDNETLAWATDGAGWDPLTAVAYRAGGLEHEDARRWVTNARLIHPLTAARLHRAGWSATGANTVRKALQARHDDVRFATQNDADPATVPGDAALVQWATHARMSPLDAAACVHAGLGMDEATTLVSNDTFNRQSVHVLAALTA